MGFRNWAFRNFPDSSGEPHWQFTIFDLGGALPFNRTKASYKRERRVRRLRSVDDVLDGSLKEKSAAYTRALGRNGFHTDMYMLASEFYAVLRVPGYEEGPQSIAHALKAIAFANNDRQEPDYVEIARLISVAKH